MKNYLNNQDYSIEILLSKKYQANGNNLMVVNIVIYGQNGQVKCENYYENYKSIMQFKQENNLCNAKNVKIYRENF